MIIECNICGKICKDKSGLSSHIFKQKDEDHKNYIKNLNDKILNEFYNMESCEIVAEKYSISVYYVCKLWSSLPDYNKRKSKMNSIATKKEWESGKRKVSINFTNKNYEYSFNHKHTISKETNDNIVKLFDTDLTITEISKLNACDPKTVRSVLVRNFGDDEVRERGKRITSARVSQSIKVGGVIIPSNKIYPNKEQEELLIKLFYEDIGVKEVGIVLGISYCAIKRIWIDMFGKDAYLKRADRMRSVQKERVSQITDFEKEVLDAGFLTTTNRELRKELKISSPKINKYYFENYSIDELNKRKSNINKIQIMRKLKSIGYKGITGSRPENLCYDLLKEKLGDEVVHHDTDTLPPFEIDITIPSEKVAICWDGPFHREPIFGQDRLAKVQNRDNRKHTQLMKMGWRVIVVEDNNKRLNEKFVQEKVGKIIHLINSHFKGKVIC